MTKSSIVFSSLAAAVIGGFAVQLTAQTSLPDASTPMAKYWLRMYPLTPYSEIWHVSLQVRDIRTAVPKAMHLFEKNSGQITLPLENFAASHKHKYQQLAYQVTPKGATKVVKGLGSIGEIDSLVKNPAADPAILSEIQEKLTKLQKDRRANKDALAKMPAVSDLVQELEEHLNLVNKVHTEARDKILLNLEIHEPTSTADKDHH